MRTRIGRRGFVKGLAAAAGLLGSPPVAAGAQRQNRPPPYSVAGPASFARRIRRPTRIHT